jgi:hypothetical protein
LITWPHTITHGGDTTPTQLSPRLCLGDLGGIDQRRLLCRKARSVAESTSFSLITWVTGRQEFAHDMNMRGRKREGRAA